MIKKELVKPQKIEKLEALLRRLHVEQSFEQQKRKKIEAELAKALAGYRGEKSIDYYLGFLQKENFIIFHDLRLPFDENRYFQLDILLLSQNFLLILEIKNISGSLFFDGIFKQLIRTQKDGSEDTFLDPVSQVKLQKFQLEAFLKKHKYSPIPVIPLIVVANSSTAIRASQNNQDAQQLVIHSINIPTKINQLQKKHTREFLTTKELKSISRLFLKNDSPSNSNIIELFGVTEANILSGVQCPKCSVIPMLRKYGTWACCQCFFQINDAHIAALKDYFLLIDNTITNNQLRNFLQLSSVTTATKILAALNLKFTGSRKSRKYYLDF